MMDDDKTVRLRDMVFSVEDVPPPTWWWLSFADSERPAGQQFLGVAIVQGQNIGFASMMAHRHGCNPGGQVVGYPIPERFTIPPEFQNTLLDRGQCEALDALMGGDGVSRLDELDDETLQEHWGITHEDFD